MKFIAVTLALAAAVAAQDGPTITMSPVPGPGNTGTCTPVYYPNLEDCRSNCVDPDSCYEDASGLGFLCFDCSDSQ